jgi:hypothetical protein
MLHWRELIESDLEACFEVQPADLGAGLVDRATAMGVWRKLLKNHAFVSRVIFDGPGLKGFGASAFLVPEFLDRELARPRLGINSSIIAGLARGERILLNRDEIARANGRGGIHAYILASPWWKTSNPVEHSDFLLASGTTCVEGHAGYRMDRFIVEFSRDLACAFAGTAEFEVLFEDRALGGTLVAVNREGTAFSPSSIFNLLFRYQEPVLGLTDAQQQLLIAVMNGATDLTLAAELGVTYQAVKKRWVSVLQKVEGRKPDLFSGLALGEDGKRGPQRRHRVLSYVRAHPEELRPYRAVSPKRSSGDRHCPRRNGTCPFSAL